MKKLITIAALCLAACSGKKEAEAEQPKKTVVCDSIKESSFDAEGNEILTSKLHCDTVIQEPEKK